MSIKWRTNQMNVDHVTGYCCKLSLPLGQIQLQVFTSLRTGLTANTDISSLCLDVCHVLAMKKKSLGSHQLPRLIFTTTKRATLLVKYSV